MLNSKMKKKIHFRCKAYISAREAQLGVKVISKSLLKMVFESTLTLSMLQRKKFETPLAKVKPGDTDFGPDEKVNNERCYAVRWSC